MGTVFTQRLTRAMFLKGIRQADLVEKTGIDKGSISSYVNGRYMPNAEKVAKIAAALGVSVDYLLGKEEFKYSDLLPEPIMLHDSTEYYTNEEAELLEAWKKADPQTRRIVAYALNLREKVSDSPEDRS